MQRNLVSTGHQSPTAVDTRRRRRKHWMNYTNRVGFTSMVHRPQKSIPRTVAVHPHLRGDEIARLVSCATLAVIFILGTVAGQTSGTGARPTPLATHPHTSPTSKPYPQLIDITVSTGISFEHVSSPE